ncbi:MAG: FtsL-like putative cell division protein [Bacteroidia bacterium]|nr:FtsL-like putative cell division protein [Bacteroidia bacterium]
MPKNKIIQNNTINPNITNEENKKQQVDKPASKGIIIKILSKIFGGKYLENQMVIENIPFFIFLIFIGLLYITNTNIADKKIRNINKLNKELKELRSEYIITKSELMFLNKQSEIAKRLEPLGIKEISQQPYLIISPDSTLRIY